MQNNKFLLSCFFVCLFFGVRLNAQGLFQCGPNNATSSCETTCISCDLNGVTGITNVNLPPGPPQTLCHDQLVLNNPRWYGFIAGSTSVSLGITPTNCQTGNGLEAAILDHCTGVPGCAAGPVIVNPQSGMFIVQAAGLIVGQPYQLVIDGFNGDVCDFSITVIDGSTVGPPLGTVNPIQGQTQVCPNATATYSIPPVANAVSYTWSAPAGASINGGSNVRTFPAAGNNSVEIKFGNAGGQVCVTASNACSTPQTTCLPVSNVPIPVTVLPNETVCYEQIPYEWPEEPHTILAAPGTYTLTSTPYSSYLGCDSIVRQTLKVLPINQVNLPVRYLCNDECYEINGLLYCDNGSYQEHFTASTGCDSLVNFTLVKIISNAVVQFPDTITCRVTSVPLSGVGSSTGNTVSYKWLNPDGQVISNSITATANAPGQYALIVTNFVGGVQCKDTAYVNVIGDLTPPQANAGPDMTLSCVITQVQLQGTGSQGPNFTYFWKPLLGGNIVSGATTLTPIVNATGTYSLRVTNEHNGCTAVSNAVVTAQVTPPTVNVTGGIMTCNQPSITLQLTTNAQSPSYVWTGPNNFASNLQNPTVNVEGTYSVTVTNGVTGCTNTGSAEVIDNTNPPGVEASGGDITCVENTVTLNANSAAQGVSYTWSGPNGFNSSLQNPTVSAVGNYQVVAHAPNGCTSTAIAVVALNTTPPGTVLSASGNLNCNNNSVNLLASSIGNPFDYNHSWTLPDGSMVPTGTQPFLAASAPGPYSVFVTSLENGCTSTASYVVIQNANVSAAIDKLENAKCFDSNDGSLSVAAGGGNGSYSYAWSNGETTALIANLVPGVYVATVTDGENCTATVSATVSAPDAIVVGGSSTDQTTNGSADGTATANPSGGTPGYTYNWSNGETTQSINGLLPGSYTVSVTDANGCVAIQTLNVSAYNCTIQTSVDVHGISCNGQTDGYAVLNISGGTSPFTVAWSTGETSDTISNLSAGQYSVSITDAANCPEVQTFTIIEPQVLAANATGSTTSGANTNDGTASANPTGGTAPYTYNWTTGDTTATISNLAPGSYRLTVTDANGCSDIQTVDVLPGNCGLTTDLLLTNPTCNGASNGAATILVTGGSGNFTYNWSSGSTSNSESNLHAGTHIVSVTEEGGCQIEVAVNLVDPPALSLTQDAVEATPCANAPEGAASVIAGGGTGTLSVEWNNGQSGLQASNLIAGPYTAVVTDENGCTSSLTVTVPSTDVEAPVITALNAEVPIGPNGDVALSVQNTGVVAEDNCAVASVVFDPAGFSCTQLGDHVVMVTATDDSGNSASQTFTVKVVDNTAPTVICSPSLVLCNENNPVTYQAPTASDNCLINGGSFNIVEGLPIGAIFPLGSTTTTYSFTDAQGNVGTCSFEVTILTPLVVAVDTVIDDFNHQNSGAIFIDVSGSLSPYTYSWTLNGQEVSTEQNPSNLPGGDYTVVVTDDNGCTRSLTVTVKNTSETADPSIMDDIVVYPNPTSGLLSVMLPNDLSSQTVFLQAFDLTGRRVLEQNSVNDAQITVDFHDLANGLYTLVIRIDKNQVVRKIVLNR